MSVQLLFNIILKVLGIYFIKDIILALPPLISILYDIGQFDIAGALTTFLLSSATLFIYGVVVYFLVFRTDYVIRKLEIVENVPEDQIAFNIHRSTLLTIVVLVVALLLITQAFPLLIRGLSKWYLYNQATKGYLTSREPFDYSLILVYVAEIIIGLLLIGHQRQIVNFIELKQRKNRDSPSG